MRDKVEQLQAEIERGVAELVEGEDWRRYLEVIARFPRYSARNALLIRLQCPTAMLVAGYKTLQGGLQVEAAAFRVDTRPGDRAGAHTPMASQASTLSGST
jgi:hypothetical protein